MDTTLSHARPAPSAADDDRVPRYSLGWARSGPEIEEVQRLRYEVFGGELGAHLTPAFDRAGRRLDRDVRDARCDHLVVCDRTGTIVGTYRLLSPHHADGNATGGVFEMSGLDPARDGLVELGRACVHPGHRRGPVVMLLWKGIADYMREGGYPHAFGCASIGMADGGRLAASIHRGLVAQGRVSARLTMRPRVPLELTEIAPLDDAEPPVLVRAYLRIGADLCGPPAWDPHFNTADLPMLLSLGDVDARYRARFLAG